MQNVTGDGAAGRSAAPQMPRSLTAADLGRSTSGKAVRGVRDRLRALSDRASLTVADCHTRRKRVTLVA
jgi:hypothetical protein